MEAKTPAENKKLKVLLFLALLLIGALSVPYALSMEEPGRILLLGAAFIALAVWGRRRLARQERS